MSATFADAAVRIGGTVGIALGWAPETFWTATPAEVAAIVAAGAGDVPAALGSAELARLMEGNPDG